MIMEIKIGSSKLSFYLILFQFDHIIFSAIRNVLVRYKNFAWFMFLRICTDYIRHKADTRFFRLKILFWLFVHGENIFS
jgi:hypothetical protein